MGLFDIFSKKVNSNDDTIWSNFCSLDESYKDDVKLKPIYYLKLYGKNEVNNNKNMIDAAKRDFISAISKSIGNSRNPIIECLIDYLINRQNILDNNKLIDIISNLNKDSLDNIANSHTFFSYIQTREKLNNMSFDEINQLVRPLEEALNRSDNQYNIFISKYSKEFKNYILNINRIITDCINTSIRFENYDFNNGKSKIYFYDNGVVVAFNEDEQNASFVINKFRLLDRMYKIKRLMFINNELFTKNYKQIILTENISYSLESEFYSKKPYYIFKHDVYGDIEFYYNEDGIELKCNVLNNIFNVVQVMTFDYDREEDRLLYVHSIEKIIVMKDNVLDKLYEYALMMCSEWDEKDEYDNPVTINYVKEHLNLSVEILSKSEEKIEFIISGCSDYLLGGHSIDAIVEDNNIKCLFQ